MIQLAILIGVAAALIAVAAVVVLARYERHRPWQGDERHDADGLHVFDDDDFFNG